MLTRKFQCKFNLGHTHQKGCQRILFILYSPKAKSSRVKKILTKSEKQQSQENTHQKGNQRIFFILYSPKAKSSRVKKILPKSEGQQSPENTHQKVEAGGSRMSRRPALSQSQILAHNSSQYTAAVGHL